MAERNGGAFGLVGAVGTGVLKCWLKYGSLGPLPRGVSCSGWVAKKRVWREDERAVVVVEGRYVILVRIGLVESEWGS